MIHAKDLYGKMSACSRIFLVLRPSTCIVSADPLECTQCDGARIRFHVLLLHCTNEVVKNHAFQNIIVETICTDKPSETNVKHAIQLVLHRLAQSHVEDESTQDWVRILANIVHRTQTAPDINTVDILLSCFESEALKILSSRPLPAAIREGKYLTITNVNGPHSSL